MPEKSVNKKKNPAKIILVVEDEKFLRQLITRKLESEGYKVIKATDGKEAIEKIKRNKPDLVLLDLILPDTDGFGVLEKIKKEPKLSKIPIIILSNLGQNEDIDKGLKLGATDYLIKTRFTPAEIIEKVNQIIK